MGPPGAEPWTSASEVIAFTEEPTTVEDGVWSGRSSVWNCLGAVEAMMKRNKEVRC